MTGLQLQVLGRAVDDTHPGFKGSALMFEYQTGRMRQVKRLTIMKAVRVVKGRVVATAWGRKLYKFHRDGHGI